ncbi:MAG: porin [Gallionella sp.]|nr:MAG: porin [Gallionella sp.]
MQKKIIALAIASALAAPAAFADTGNVSVYGVANVSFDLTDNGAVSVNKVSSSQSHFGLKGTEDLGDGLSTIWQIESQINIDNSAAGANGGGGLATRNSFVGLSSKSAGTLLAGRHDTPYKIATRGLDVFADSIADNRGLMGSTAGGAGFTSVHDARVTDVAAYISPTINGFTGIGAYVIGAESASTAAQTKGKALSFAGLYGNGPINASLAYQVVDYGSAGTSAGQTLFTALGAGDKSKAWKLGGGYTMDAVTVNAVYEKTTNTITGASALGQNNWYLGGKFNVNANDAVKLAYTKAGDVQATTNTGAKQWALGYDHNMSKRTSVYALYTRLDNDSGASYSLTSISTGGGTAVVAGNDPSAWSFGMKHSF